MLFFDLDTGSMQWGCDQVVHLNKISEDADGVVCIELKPSYNKSENPTSTFVVTACVAGMRDGEIQARVDHLQDGTNVLVFSGESVPRPAGKGKMVVYKTFQNTMGIPRDVRLDSMSSHFSDGLLVVSFDKV